jgi:serine protease AprX
VAGLIAGAGRQSTGAAYQGMAPGARLIGLRVLDAQGADRTSDVLRALESAVKFRTAIGIDTGTPVRSPFVTTSLPTVTLFGGMAEPWSQSIVWGDNIVWGNTLLDSR